MATEAERLAISTALAHLSAALDALSMAEQVEGGLNEREIILLGPAALVVDRVRRLLLERQAAMRASGSNL